MARAGAARRGARAASLIAVSRSALRARRRGRCAPFAPGRAATGCHRRLALRARRRWHRRAARPGAFGSPVARPRAARSEAWALRARAPTCSPRSLARVASWWWGSVEDVVRCALLETLGATRASSPAEGEGGEGRSRHHDAQACGERLRAAAACAARVGATRHCKGSAFPPGQTDPRTLSARARRGMRSGGLSCLLGILTAVLPSWRRVASVSLVPSDPWCARSSNS